MSPETRRLDQRLLTRRDFLRLGVNTAATGGIVSILASCANATPEVPTPNQIPPSPTPNLEATVFAQQTVIARVASPTETPRVSIAAPTPIQSAPTTDTRIKNTSEQASGNFNRYPSNYIPFYLYVPKSHNRATENNATQFGTENKLRVLFSTGNDMGNELFAQKAPNGGLGRVQLYTATVLPELSSLQQYAEWYQRALKDSLVALGWDRIRFVFTAGEYPLKVHNNTVPTRAFSSSIENNPYATKFYSLGILFVSDYQDRNGKILKLGGRAVYISSYTKDDVGEEQAQEDFVKGVSQLEFR